MPFQVQNHKNASLGSVGGRRQRERLVEVGPFEVRRYLLKKFKGRILGGEDRDETTF